MSTRMSWASRGDTFETLAFPGVSFGPRGRGPELSGAGTASSRLGAYQYA